MQKGGQFHFLLLSRTVLISALLLLCAPAEATQVAVLDDSDWWSSTRTFAHLDLSAPTTNTLEGEPASANCGILSVVLGEAQFRQAEAKLGKAKDVSRGDAGTGRGQVCYSSIGGSPRQYLIFEAGGEGFGFSFYLFEDGANWDGSQLCAKSPLISRRVRTKSGLHLGQTPDEVRKILGKPSQSSDEKLVYVYDAKKETSAKKLEEIQRASPQMSAEEVRSSYGFYFRDAYIEARFVDSKLAYLGVTKSETFP